MIKSNSLRNMFINQNKVIIDIMIAMGGKCYFMERDYLVNLIINNNMSNSQGEIYTKKELLNVISDMIECNILKDNVLRKTHYLYLSNRSIKEFLGVNANTDLPTNLDIYKSWENKIKFVDKLSHCLNCNSFDVVMMNRYNTLFDISNSKIELLKDYFKFDVKKDIYALYSLDCFYVGKIKNFYTFYLNLKSDNPQQLIKELKNKLNKVENNIKMLVSLATNNEYRLVANKVLYIGVSSNLFDYVKNFPLKCDYITIKFVKLS